MKKAHTFFELRGCIFELDQIENLVGNAFRNAEICVKIIWNYTLLNLFSNITTGIVVLKWVHLGGQWLEYKTWGLNDKVIVPGCRQWSLKKNKEGFGEWPVFWQVLIHIYQNVCTYIWGIKIVIFKKIPSNISKRK